jgi:hypothetical protein
MGDQIRQPTPSEINDAVTKAHALRAEMFAKMFRKLFRRNKK